ncbi:FMN-binding protein [Cryobacterium adonitolivorans]|uniref:FMN-binding protein n=2 Tax=Cryobacterium adonitolivorans TaxID=1259189 RepID=A0A4R8W3S2_9MICO|nr:FMN-binding protein [Cryobacterium adonitolivorans]
MQAQTQTQTSSLSQTTDAADSAAPATTGTVTPTATGASGTFAGTAAQTRFGNVQVQIAVADGTITDVTALHLTDHDQRSVSISNRAAPVLRQQVLAAQSANVQGVSGATYTTDGYLTSLQSALDQAGL